jgi:hypothetical protein
LRRAFPMTGAAMRCSRFGAIWTLKGRQYW